LDKLVKEDASPEIRKQAVRCISRIAADGVDRTLNTASTDEVEKVRLAACEAWKARGGTAARDMLLSMAQADGSNSVRQAAVASLASFNDPEVLSTLSNLLDDKSPAIQYSVAESLASMTGQSFGGDFKGWKNYLDGSMPTSSETLSPGLSAPPVRTASGPNGLPPQ
jgi:HEAT repeat protein